MLWCDEPVFIEPLAHCHMSPLWKIQTRRHILHKERCPRCIKGDKRLLHSMHSMILFLYPLWKVTCTLKCYLCVVRIWVIFILLFCFLHNFSIISRCIICGHGVWVFPWWAHIATFPTGLTGVLLTFFVEALFIQFSDSFLRELFHMQL